MDIDYASRRVFVHYNGWPPRWDEWLDFSSARVTPFRTRTANVTTSQGESICFVKESESLLACLWL
jgi:hypothetical protein